MQSWTPSLSPVTLAEDSCSLDSCSSHGFSSLQSPSAFPSFFSNDGSQQIDTFQPLSLDSAELCHCHLRYCCQEAARNIEQDYSVSASNLPSEEEPLLHSTHPQKLVCPFHSSSEKTQRRNCNALPKDLELDCIQRGSLLEEGAVAEHSLPSYPSSLPDNTEFSASLLIQDRYNAKELPVFERGFLSSFPHPEECSALLPSNDINHVYSNAFHSRINTTQQFKSFETRGQINETACTAAHITQSCGKSSCIMPSEVVPSVLMSPVYTFPMLTKRHGDADDRENFTGVHITGSRERRVRLFANLSPSCSVEAKLNLKREDNDALQEVHENKKIMYPPCKEGFLNTNVVDEASKENIGPHVFEQGRKRVGGAKADSNGWMCPKDAKKNFKPKPRQLLLDKWLARQR